MTTLKRIHDWFAEPPALSWFAHSAVAIAAWFLGHVIASEAGGMVMGLIAFSFYSVKEIRDAAKYWKKDELGTVVKGATRRADGWGDMVGPTVVMVMSLLTWWTA